MSDAIAPAAPSSSPSPASSSSPRATMDAAGARAAREALRARKLERDRLGAQARRDARKGPTSPASPASSSSPSSSAKPSSSSPAPAELVADVRTDEQRAADAAVFLRALYRVAAPLVALFGFELAPLTESEAAADATYLVPLARRHLIFDRLCAWIGAPAALVARFASKLHRRAAAPAPAGAPDGARLVALPNPRADEARRP